MSVEVERLRCEPELHCAVRYPRLIEFTTDRSKAVLCVKTERMGLCMQANDATAFLLCEGDQRL